jgi:nucleotide-binding universal stress UspA family protein
MEGLSPLDAGLDHKALDEERAYLDRLSKKLCAETDVRVTTALTEGVPPDALLAQAAAKAADLIVMTTHGRGPLSRFWLGSVADEMVRRATVPVLLLRPAERTAALKHEWMVRTILVPLDGSSLAEEALVPGMVLGKLMGASFTLLRVLPPVTYSGMDITGQAVLAGAPHLLEALRMEAQLYLERVAARLRTAGVAVQTRVILEAQPAAAILEEVRDGGHDLIALETHGRAGLERFFLGSVADKVVRGAAIPVLVDHHPQPKK